MAESKKAKKDIVKKYFTQKRWNVVDYIFLGILAVGIIFFVFIWGYIGIILMLIGGVTTVFLRSAKIKDSEIEAELSKLTENVLSEAVPENTLCAYDMTAQPSVRGKDSKIRTPEYVITTVDFKKGIRLTVNTFDMYERSVDTQTYTLAEDERITLVEDSFATGFHKPQYLIFEKAELKIPVSTNDVRSAELIEKLCG